ncbi:hypothetical protein HMPREF0208_01114 [Citrobacter koseri]|nr:hypothetical protein HMPREF3220_01931 [Citrobacter koseri]KXA04187.1 hypothetical protein HMPREF3207_01544 [Citrobacter koseri]KXB45665.1 hypothetical protein HMPREF0208_01114 [Citrobacter koseri]
MTRLTQSLPERLLFAFFYSAFNLSLKNNSPPFRLFRFIT